MIRGEVALAASTLAGLPMINVENACASGSSALHVAVSLVEAGRFDCVLALGVEKLIHEDRTRSVAALMTGMDVTQMTSRGAVSGSPMMEMYATAARRRMVHDDALNDAMAAVAVKNRRHASRNPRAQFQHQVTADEVKASRLIVDPLRLLMCSPLSDGAAAVIVRRSRSVASAPRVVALGSSTHRAGASVVRTATRAMFHEIDVTPKDVDVWQLHDASAYAEISQYEELGICPPGHGSRWVLDGRTSAAGDSPVNTDGGLLSRGHPLGATGLVQIVELTAQLRGTAGWQVPDARTAVAVNAGGWMGDDYATCFATMLRCA
jgi:acetyl-CoA acetyltransferase